VHLAELAEAHRQLAVTAQAMLENLHVPGTVHGLDAVRALIRSLGEKHVLAEGLQVTGLRPQARVHQFRRVYFLVAGLALTLAHVGDQSLENLPALGMPEDSARGFF